MADKVKRVRYFNKQFLKEADFNDEQGYHLGQQREHMRLMHTPGVSEGLVVAAVSNTSVSISAGTAYDGKGRRLVLSDNIASRPVSGTGDVYLTLSFGQAPVDEDTQSGGATRWLEEPNIEFRPGPGLPDPQEYVVLALVKRDGSGVVTAIDTTNRASAGVKGGDLAVNSVTFGGFTPPVKAQLGAASRLDLNGGLRVTGDLAVTGNITGTLPAGSVGAATLAAGAVGTAALANLGVTLAKLAANSVDATKIVDGSVGTAELAAAAVTIDKIGAAAVDETKLANGAVSLVKLAPTVQTTLTEKINGCYIVRFLTLPLPAPGTILISARDLRGKLLRVEGWASSGNDLSPLNLLTTTPSKVWTVTPTASVPHKSVYAFCKSTTAVGAAGATLPLFDQTEGANTISFALEFAAAALNLRVTGTAGFTVGFALQISWSET